ncbi:unnamed protein product [Ectocarpus sp. CCAP 1310/34]|nr:unnamed protein product [Ectocarpus sp. CCAP 1310/34]
MSNGGGRRPRPPPFGRSSEPGEPSNDQEDNPFVRQLELMLKKSAGNRAAAVSPPPPRARAAANAGPTSAWRPRASLSSGGGGAASGRAVATGASQYGGQSLMANSKPEEKRAGTSNGGGGLPRAPSRSLFSLPESSSDEDEDAFQRRYFGLPPLRKPSAAAAAATSVAPPAAAPAEAKVARPGFDGGWPETKRCSPPNLTASLISNGRGAAYRKTEGGRGDSRGDESANGSKGNGKDKGPSARDGDAASSGRAGLGITGGGWYGGAGITRSQPTARRRTGDGIGSAGAAAAVSDNEWMSDAEDPRGATPNADSATMRAGGLKRGRTPPTHHRPYSPGSDGSNCGGDGGRGRKTGRLEGRYPAPMPARRERSNSLSLSPPRLLTCDHDYVTSDEEDSSKPGAWGRRKGSRGGESGGRKELQLLSNPATAGSTAIGRGRKRGHEDLLNEKIKAMRVGSDGEGPHAGGGGGGRGRRRGGAIMMGPDEEEEDIDYEDLKPHIEDPPWRGELVPFDLEEGGFINPSINRYLRDYQREGVRWLYAKFQAGQGGILGDDMGLGKTVQSIALLASVLRKSGTGRDSEELRRRRKEGLPASSTGLPWLIVAPAAVVPEWIKQIKVWGHFAAYQLESGRDADAGRYEVVATSYDLLRACVDRLKKQRFDAVIFDEYHTIKSATTMVSQAACELRTKRVFGLTGTLIQNDMKELWFLLHLIDPLAVGEQSRFTEHFSEPIKRARAMNATASDRRLGEKRLKELDGIRDKNMIRRTKDEELGDVLKGKSDTVVFCDLSEVQRELYQRVLSLPEFQLLARAKEPCNCGRSGRPTRARCCHKTPDSRGGGGDGVDPRAVLFRRLHPTLMECEKCPFCCQLPAVSKLQKIANHPCLLQENIRDPEQKRQQQRKFAEVAFTDRAKEIMGGLERSQKFLDVSKVGVCGKMKSLETLLAKFHETRDKVLVFSWSTAMLDVLESFVGAKGYVYRRLDGTTSGKERQARINEFNSDRAGVFVFLISTRAGGQGLNLHTASRVVLYDVNWNPALGLQAQDRAYRIGQKRKVAVFRLISKGTIEEMCYMRQIYKLQITSAAMGDQARGGRRQFNAGSKEQQGELFGIQNLLKFSDDSLLKTLRMKHEAGLAAATAAGGGAAAAAAGGAGSKGVGGITGVDAADEGDLVVAMKNALGLSKETGAMGEGEGPREDSELAGLLGDLGVDAYTHDQLVAKDEGEGELAEESCGVAELTLSPLPAGGARTAMEETIAMPRSGGGCDGGGGVLVPSAGSERKSAARATEGVVGRSQSLGPRGPSVSGGSGQAQATAAAVVEIEDGTAGAPGGGQPQQQEPAKKRRNLASLGWGKGRAGVGSSSGARIELFMPQYGSGGGGRK